MQEWTLDTQLDRQSFSLTAQASGECAAGKLVDVSTLPGETHPRREGGSVVLEVPLSCSVLYQDAEGRLQSTLLRTSVSAETAAAGNVDCAVAELRCGEAFCTAAAGALELRLPIALEVSATAQERLQLVCGGTVSVSRRSFCAEPSETRRSGRSRRDCAPPSRPSRGPTQSTVTSSRTVRCC